MDMKMDNDTESDDNISNHSSDSNSSSSTSNSTSDESESNGPNIGHDGGDYESVETAKILKNYIELPKGLCENANIFNEFFSHKMWNSLPEQVKQHLKVNFLPNFPANDELQKDITIQKLFNREIFRFGKSPLVEFQKNLEEGNFRPDIAKLQSTIKKNERREQRFLECERISRIAKAMMLSREKLLRAAYNSPPGVIPKVDRTIQNVPRFSSTPAAARAKKRYFQEISNVVDEVGLDGPPSDDENYPEGPPAQLSRKQKRHLSGIQGGASSPGAELRVHSTSALRMGNLDHLVGPGGTTPLTEECYKQMLMTYKKRRLEEPDHPDLDISDIKVKDVHARTQLSAGHRRTMSHSKLINGGFMPNNLATASTSKKQSLTPSGKNIKVEPNSFQAQFAHHFGQTLLSTSASSSQCTGAATTPHNISQMSDDSDDDFMVGGKSIKVEPKLKFSSSSLTPELVSSAVKANLIDHQHQHHQHHHHQQSISNQRLSLTPISSSNSSGIGDSLKMSSPADKKKKLNNSSKTTRIEINTTTPASPSTSGGNALVSPNSNLINIANYSGKVKPATLSDLEGIDMMHLPVDLDEAGNIDILSGIETSTTGQLLQTHHHHQHLHSDSHHQSVSQPVHHLGSSKYSGLSHRDKVVVPELMQETHACFLSLIRDIFCSTPDHRTTMDVLQNKIMDWVANPITPLNDWYSLVDNWLNQIPSAINFLSGEFNDQPEDFVPYIEYKTNLHIYQWIGAGRDTDSHLMPLCMYWLSRKHEMAAKPIKNNNNLLESGKSSLHSRSLSSSMLSNSNTTDDDELMPPERPPSPPPPRFPTNWVVKRAIHSEIEEFRRQERVRFENPHLAFTYRMHGFESVVGPVKGIYTHQVPGVNKARGHNMLVADRPNFVTILILVRDATARLPNGEGTRADICELLKSSQYINPDATDVVLQTIVSGALDRMHTEHDPCVRYDPKRKIWIYLHRDRSKEEFERLHQAFQGMGKHKKITPRKFKPKKPIGSPISSSLIQSVLQPMKPIQHQLIVATKSQSTIVSSNSIVVAAAAPTAIASTSSSSIEHVQTVSMQTQIQKQPPPLASPLPPIQMPTLSSISTPTLPTVLPPTSTSQTQPPPLINKFPLSTQKTLNLKPELVPIKMMASPIVDKSIPELIDVEAALDTQNPPAPVLINITSPQVSPHLVQQSPVTPQSNAPQNMPSLIINQSPSDKSGVVVQKFNKMVAKSIVTNTPIKLSTSTGIQTIHVSSSMSPISTSKPLTSILSSPNQQSILLNHNRSNSPIVVSASGMTTCHTTVGGVKKIGKPILISHSQAPPLISQSSTTPTMAGQSYIIPINIGSQSMVVNQTTTSNPKLLKASSNPPALTSTIAPKSMQPNVVTSIAGGQKITAGIIRANSQQSKSLINPAIVQQRATVIAAASTPIPPKPVQIRPNISIAKTNIGQLHQQSSSNQHPKQIVQNFVVQQKPGIQQRNTATLVATTPSGGQTIKSIIIAPSQNQAATLITTSSAAAVAAANPMKAVTATTTTAGGSSLINPQIIQIQQNNQQVGGKIQTLTLQQQQNLLATLKQHQIRNNQQRGGQQSLIIKPQSILQQVQQKPSGGPGQTTNVNVTGQSIVKSGQSLLGANIVGSSAVTPTTLTQQQQTQSKSMASPQPIVTRILKPGTSIIQQQIQPQQTQMTQQQQAQQKIKTTQMGGTVILPPQTPSNKVLTNSTGQIISLESLLQKSGFAPGTTIRVAGSKPGQTSLIQLASVPGSPVTQYAVVSQGRNIIPIQNAQRIVPTSSVVVSQSSAPHPITTSASAGGGAISSSTSLSTASNSIIKTEMKSPSLITSISSSPSPSTPSSSSNVNVTTSPISTQPTNKIIHQVQTVSVGGGSAVTQAATAKLKPGIRMLNASTLNLAQFGGKPVIIASKTGGGNVTGGSQLGQNVIIQSAAGQNASAGASYVIQGGQAFKIQNAPQTQTVMLNNQLVKLQTQPNIIASSSATSNNSTSTVTSMAKTMVLGTTATGQTITKVQPGGQPQQVVLSTAIKGGAAVKVANPNQQRLVFAVQGGGQILLPPGFQGGSINLKTLQGLKVIPIQQQNQPNKGNTNDHQPNQVYAQILTSPQRQQQHQQPTSSTTVTSNSSTGSGVNTSGGTGVTGGNVQLVSSSIQSGTSNATDQ